MLIVGLMVLLSQIASVCFIAYACFMLPRYSVNAKHRADAMVSVKFVYNNYRADVWFYSFLMLVRNLITAFVPAIAPNEPSIQLAIMTQSLICSFALHCYLWPWHMPLCNAMDFISLSCCLSLVVLAAAWLPRSNNDAFFTTVTEIMMTIAIFGGIITAAISFLLMTPFSKKNPMLAKLGLRWHYVGEIPEVEETAELLSSSASRIATKKKKEMCATIYDLDAYDKRRLIFMARFLDSEFHVQTAENSDAPLPIRRIKSTNSLGSAEVGEAEEKGGEGGRVVTV